MASSYGILERMFHGNVSYENADDSDRKKLIAVFVIALILFLLHLIYAIDYYSMKEIRGTVISCERTQRTHHEYGKGPTFRRTWTEVSYDTKIEYTVNERKYIKRKSLDTEQKLGTQVRLFYNPRHPNHAELKIYPWPALFCLFHAVVMLLTGIPTCSIKYLFGLRTERW